MAWCLFLAMIYLAAVLETSFASVWAVGPIVPLALLAAALSAVMARPSQFGRFAAGAAGLLSDLLGPGRLGLGMASFFLGAWFVLDLQRRLGWRSVLLQSLLIWPVATAHAAAVAGSSQIGNSLPLGGVNTLTEAAGTGLYTAAVSVPWLMIFAWRRRTASDGIER